MVVWSLRKSPPRARGLRNELQSLHHALRHTSVNIDIVQCTYPWSFLKRQASGPRFFASFLAFRGVLIWVGVSEIKDVTGVPLRTHWACAGLVRMEVHTTLQWWAEMLKDSSVNAVGFGQYRRYLRTQAWKVLGFANLARKRLALWHSRILAK